MLYSGEVYRCVQHCPSVHMYRGNVLPIGLSICPVLCCSFTMAFLINEDENLASLTGVLIILIFPFLILMMRRPRNPAAPQREFSNEQRIWLALEWIKREHNGRTFSQIQAEFRQKWPGKSPPATHTTVRRMKEKLEEYGSVGDRRKGRSGAGDFMETGRRNNLNVSQSSFVRLKAKIKFHAYRMRRVHKISPQNVLARMHMGQLLQTKMIDWFSNLAVSDEAWFYLNGHVHNRYGGNLEKKKYFFCFQEKYSYLCTQERRLPQTVDFRS